MNICNHGVLGRRTCVMSSHDVTWVKSEYLARMFARVHVTCASFRINLGRLGFSGSLFY